MREYDSSGISNVAVVGHGGSGKTSLVDALCFAAGNGKRHSAESDYVTWLAGTPTTRSIHHLQTAHECLNELCRTYFSKVMKSRLKVVTNIQRDKNGIR